MRRELHFRRACTLERGGLARFLERQIKKMRPYSLNRGENRDSPLNRGENRDSPLERGGLSLFTADGFTYIALLAAIVILGIMLGAAGKYWSHVMLREKEAELLFRGDQYVRAIESYYTKPPNGHQPILPPSIDELLKDSRFATRRHLRKKYKDPITGEDFTVIQDATKRVIGVKSTSDKEPLKKGNFPKGYETFQGKTKYSEWEFKFTPAQQ
jgi:type II secretory pathway pseudopilin PulG